MRTVNSTNDRVGLRAGETGIFFNPGFAVIEVIT
jgi:hypothetical protein